MLWVELCAGLAFTAAIVYFHGFFAAHAGGLWRDEANTAGLSTMPTLGDVWNHLEFDSFPMVWLVVIRVLSAIGLGGDAPLRFVGMSMGILSLAGLWFCARSFRTGPPLFSLFLAALAPTVIVWGDTLRAHGVGLATGLIAYAMTWRLAERGDRRALLGMLLATVLAVQTSYYNCIVVLAACFGGLVACIQQGNLRRSLMVILAGVPSAVSILPYLPVFHRATDWNNVLYIPEYNLPIFWANISFALGHSGIWVVWLWLILLGFAAVLGIAAFSYLPDWKVPHGRQQVITFNLVALFVLIVGYFLFLKSLHYGTHEWYYVSLFGLVAAGIDGVCGASCINLGARITRLTVAVAAFIALLPPTMQFLPYRLTDIDLIAAKLKEIAKEKDFVVVDPWYCGITYARYNSSAAPWSTLPPMDFHRFHRFDLIKQMMQEKDQADPLRQLIQQIGETLRANGKVYFVGGFRNLAPGSRPVLLPPAPSEQAGWSSDTYSLAWSTQIGYFIQNHAIKADVVIPSEQSEHINPYENTLLVSVEGWRD